MKTACPSDTAAVNVHRSPILSHNLVALIYNTAETFFVAKEPVPVPRGAARIFVEGDESNTTWPAGGLGRSALEVKYYNKTGGYKWREGGGALYVYFLQTTMRTDTWKRCTKDCHDCVQLCRVDGDVIQIVLPSSRQGNTNNKCKLPPGGQNNTNKNVLYMQ